VRFKTRTTGEQNPMLFSSVTFLFFFLPFILALYALAGSRGRNAVFLLGSLLFYSWSEGRYTAVLLLSIAVNHALGLAMGSLEPHPSSRARILPGHTPEEVSAARRSRRAILVTGLLFNLGLLAYFKYAGFFLSAANALFPGHGAPPFSPARNAVPTGISFFTFTAISYLVDIYKGRAEAEPNPSAFAIHMAAFPKILAGPIVPYHLGRTELGQRAFDLQGFATGIERFILGLGKKVLIANPLAGVVDQVFDLPPESLTTGLAWLGIVLYSLQIFFDFSGYTDMAIGLGRLFGFHLPENFNFPYAAQSIQDFWRRWHMSLSRWLRDYLYIPLGGNRCTPVRHYLNLMTVFLLCGLWHGANWTFVVWGLWYGVFLILERTRFGQALKAAPRPFRHLYAVLVIVLGWVFFRSETLGQSAAFFRALAGLGTGSPPPGSVVSLVDNEVLLALCVGLTLSVPLVESVRRLHPKGAAPGGPIPAGVVSIAYGLFLGSIFLLSCMALAGGTLKSFIYFRF
jgi:alginate O-acetyltransferase complex protein AlgI